MMDLKMATFTAVLLVVYFSMARSGDAQSIRSYVYGIENEVFYNKNIKKKIPIEII